MVAARNIEAQFAADSPYANVITAKLYNDRRKYDGMPRYDARFAREYARSIMKHGGFLEELMDEQRMLARNDNGYWRADASLSLAFARSLEYIIRKPYEAEYPELRAPEFIPVMTEVPPEANSFTYRMLDKMGQAAIINDSGSDAPKVEVKGEEWQQPVVTLGASYDYTILDSMRAARMGIPLEAYKAEACRFACEYLNEQLAAVGNSGAGLAGLSNAPGIIAVTQVSPTGGATGGNWMQQVASIGAASLTNATPPAVVVAQQISADLLAMKMAIFNATNGIHEATDALISVPAYSALAGAPRSPGYTKDTLLDYLEDLVQLKVSCWPQLNQAGATSTGSGATLGHGRVVCYKKDPKILSLVIPQPFTQLPPHPVRMAWEVIGYMRTGAVQVRFPKAVAYMDGVS